MVILGRIFLFLFLRGNILTVKRNQRNNYHVRGRLKAVKENVPQPLTYLEKVSGSKIVFVILRRSCRSKLSPLLNPLYFFLSISYYDDSL